MALDILDIDIGGTTDSSGNLTLSQTPSPAYWCILKVVAQTSGAAQWAILVNGSGAAFGRGPRVDLGPIVLQPRDQVQVVVTDAIAQASLKGKLLGIRAATVQEALQHYVPSPNTIALDTIARALLTDRIDTAAGSGSKSYPMPLGGQTIVLQVDQANASRNVGPTQLLVRCFPSDFIAIQIGGSAINLNTQALGLLNPIDTAFDVEWTMVGANPLNTFVDVAVLGQNLQKPQNIPFQFDANSNLFVSMAAASPASWQAPNSGNGGGTGTIGAGADLTLIPLAAGKVTQIHVLIFNIVGVAGSFCDLEDDTGTLLGWRVDTGQTTPGPVPIPFYGRNVGVHGVKLHNSSGVATGAINFGAQFSQV